MSILGNIILIVFILGIVFTFISRFKEKDYRMFPDESGTISFSLGSGFFIGLLFAILFVLGLREDRREINWWLITAVFALGGGLTGVVIQIISFFPISLYLWFSSKFITKKK
jgi:hypothetical protein